MRKSNWKFLIFTAAVFFICAGHSAAQQNISPEKQALIREFVEASGGQDGETELTGMLVSFHENASAQMLSSIIDEEKSFTLAQKKELKQMIPESAQRIGERIRQFSTDQMLKEVIYPSIDKNFTENELRDIIAFYRSPSGQKLMAFSSLAHEEDTALQEKFMSQYDTLIKNMIDEEFALLKKNYRTNKKRKKQTLKKRRVNPSFSTIYLRRTPIRPPRR